MSSRELRRSTDNKVIAGVAGGIGRYFGVDPVFFRIAFILFTIAGGAGFAVYVILWLIMPRG